MFYVLSVMAESEATRRHGFVVVGKNTRKGTLEINTNTRGLSLLRSEVTLARVVAGHLVVLENRPLLTTFASLIVGVAERLKVLRKGEIVVHNGPSDSDSLVKKLQAHGFDMEGIPTVPFGGLFSFGCFKAWVEDRIRLETAGPGAGVAVSETDPTLAEEDEKRKKKRIDAAYCRRKRFRKKIEVEVMQAEVQRLQQQNERLREQGNALEGSIQEERNVVERKVVPAFGKPRTSRAPSSRQCTPRQHELLRRAAKRDSCSTWSARLQHQFSASLIGARNNSFPSATHGQLQDAAYLLNASHDLSRFGQQRAVMDQLPTRSPADSLRLSDLVSEATLSSLLHQQQHLQNYPSRPSAVAYTGVSDPRRNHLAAVAAAQAVAAADLQRDGLDRLDPYELALLQLYGGLGGPPRLI
jgi:hypothetical protein